MAQVDPHNSSIALAQHRVRQKSSYLRGGGGKIQPHPVVAICDRTQMDEALHSVVGTDRDDATPRDGFDWSGRERGGFAPAT